MQSDYTASAMRKLGHVRRQSYGKMMPISTLLGNLISIHMAPTPNTSPASPSDPNATTRPPFDALAVSSKINERSDAMPTILATINVLEAQTIGERSPASVQFLKCVNYQRRESCPDEQEPMEIADATHDTEDDIDRLLSNAQSDEVSSASTDSSHDDCDDTLGFQLLCGNLYENCSNSSMLVCRSNDGDAANRLSTDFPSDSSYGSDTKALSEQSTASPMSEREKFFSNMLTGQAIEADDEMDAHNDGSVSPLTEANLKQFELHSMEKRALDELLTNESMMNSAAVRLRLAARKLEMDLILAEAAGKSTDEYVPPRDLLMHIVR